MPLSCSFLRELNDGRRRPLAESVTAAAARADVEAAIEEEGGPCWITRVVAVAFGAGLPLVDAVAARTP